MYNTKSKQNQFKSSSSRLNPSVPAKPKQPAITDMNAFPELSSTAAPAVISSSDEPTSFANKVKWVVEEEKVEETWYGKLGLSLLVPGDKKVKTLVDETNYSPLSSYLIPAQRPRPAQPAEIMKALAEKYDKWKADYIRDYGIDEYEHLFRFPGYDYEYFDKLDEAWNLELQAQQELEDEKEREQNEEYDYDELYTSKDYN
jgi:hypothetical protein